MYMYIPAHLNTTQFTFDTIGTPHSKLIHQVIIDRNLSIKYQNSLIHTSFHSKNPPKCKLFKKGLEIIKDRAIVPVEAHI